MCPASDHGRPLTMSFEDRLQLSLSALALELTPAQRDALLLQLAELQRWNQAYNLTAVRDPGAMLSRHLMDSLAVIPALRQLQMQPRRLLDVGSGAGYPGIPLAVALPQTAVCVLDSNDKKARFLRHAQRVLGLPNLQVEEARVEAYQPGLPYDVIISRAFAALPEFVRLTRHLLAPGGRWLAMKGKLAADELDHLPEGIGILNIVPLEVPELAEERHLIVVAPR